jgi:spore germination cell wall hydrolase CwlJ-like protein|tara:strand:- start:9342 stop:9794 length:453 start_codon:yes stop_codon:yes gene_type:complete
MKKIILLLAALSTPAFAEDNERCLTEAIYFEARGETFIGQLAVGTVIMKRVESPRFPNSVCKVVRSGKYWKGNPVRNKCQFSYWCDGKSESIKDYPDLEAADTALLVMQGVRLWQVQESTHYHASYVRPSWARKMKRTAIIGKHIFYRKK